MHQIAVVLMITTIGEGLTAFQLVSQLQEKRENAKALQARAKQIERRSPQRAAARWRIWSPCSRHRVHSHRAGDA